MPYKTAKEAIKTSIIVWKGVLKQVEQGALEELDLTELKQRAYISANLPNTDRYSCGVCQYVSEQYEEVGIHFYSGEQFCTGKDSKCPVNWYPDSEFEGKPCYAYGTAFYLLDELDGVDGECDMPVEDAVKYVKIIINSLELSL